MIEAQRVQYIRKNLLLSDTRQFLEKKLGHFFLGTAWKFLYYDNNTKSLATA